jgi:peroxiredoxin
MRKFLLSLLLLPALAYAQNKGFVLTGSISGLTDGAEVKLLSTQDNSPVASGVVKNGAFTITGDLPEPNLFWLAIGTEQPQHIYLENGTVKVSGSKNDLKNIKVEGSKAHAEFSSFRTVFNPLVTTLNATAEQLQKAPSEKKREDLMRVYDSVSKEINGQVNQFVATKKSSYVSPFVIFVTAQFNQDINLVERNYQQLDSSIRTSGIGKALAEYITYNKVGAIGSEAIDFSQADTSGFMVSLSSFKGKYVLVDFWASWCKPCRLENPNVVKAYDRFKNKNFTVFGVSLDQEKAPWVKAIEKDKLSWTNVSDLQFWNNAVAQMYHVQSIPQNFLIDPTGKIIAKDLRGEELTAKLCELLGCN